MPNQIPLTPTATVIMLPQEAVNIRISEMYLHHIAYNVWIDGVPKVKYIELPQGNYQLHQNAFDVSDDVAKGIVEVWEHGLPYLETCYLHYGDVNRYHNTALRSYHSLLKSKGVERDGRWVLIIKN